MAWSVPTSHTGFYLLASIYGFTSTRGCVEGPSIQCSKTRIVFDDDVELTFGSSTRQFADVWLDLAALGPAYDIALFGSNRAPFWHQRRLSRHWVDGPILGLHAHGLTAKGLRKAYNFGKGFLPVAERHARRGARVYWDVSLNSHSGLRSVVAVPFVFDQNRELSSSNNDWCRRGATFAHLVQHRQWAALASKFNCLTLRLKLNQFVASWVYLCPASGPLVLLVVAALLFCVDQLRRRCARSGCSSSMRHERAVAEARAPLCAAGHA